MKEGISVQNTYVVVLVVYFVCVLVSRMRVHEFYQVSLGVDSDIAV